MGEEDRQREGETLLEWTLRQQRLELNRIRALELEFEDLRGRVDALEARMDAGHIKPE